MEFRRVLFRSALPTFFSLLDIGSLGVLIAASQEDYLVFINSKIHSIPGADIELQFKHSIPNRLTIAIIPVHLNTSDPGVDPIADIAINSSFDPLAKRALASSVAVILRFSCDRFHS